MEASLYMHMLQMFWPLRPSTALAYRTPHMAPRHQERPQPPATGGVQRNRSESQKRSRHPLPRHRATRQTAQTQPRGQTTRNMYTTGEQPSELLVPSNTRSSPTSLPDKIFSTAPSLCLDLPLLSRVPPPWGHDPNNTEPHDRRSRNGP